MSRRPTIGFLINDVVNTYQYTIWCGVDAGCREAGFDLTVLTGGELGSTDPVKAVRAKVFELANSHNIQGLVIGAPAVGNHLSPEQVAAYCRSFAPLPVVTIGFEIPGVPTVLVNNVAGMEEAVEHLVGLHGRKRIGFIGGPPANPEAHDRIEAYRRVLARHGLGPNPRWEAVANFDLGMARQAMRNMLDENLGLDAVVAANDAMALGALEALQERGIQVPEQISICGFDDILETSFCTPPMATVRQPIFDQGLSGVRMLREMMLGRIPQDLRPVLPANYLPRKSCGCLSEELHQAFLSERSDAPPSGSKLGAIESDLARAVPSEVSGSAGAFLGALESDLARGSCTESLNLLSAEMDKARKALRPLKEWQSFVNAMRKLVLPALSETSEALVAESIWHQMRVALSEAEVQNVAYQNVTLENKIREMNLLGSHFVNSFDEKLLIQQILEGLPRQGISTCYLLLRTPDADPSTPPRLAMAMENGRALPLPAEGVPLEPGAIFPDYFRQTENRRTLVVEPLFFNDTALGFLGYELSPSRGMVFDALRTLISAAIQGARLVQQVRQRTEELEVAYGNLESMSRQIRDILQNIEQGLFVVDLEGNIQSDCSRSVHALLGMPDVTTATIGEALRLNAAQEADFKSWLALVARSHQGMRWEKLTKVSPVRELEIPRPPEDPRFLRLAYQKMSDSDRTLRKIMVMVVDETESRRVERIVQAERARHENEVKTIVGLVNNPTEMLSDYLDDTRNRLEWMDLTVEDMVESAKRAREGYPVAPAFEPEPEILSRLFRDLHTIKGNSATYGFESLSNIAHQAEDLLEALHPPLEQRASATLAQLGAKLAELQTAFQLVLDTRQRLQSATGEQNMVRIPSRRLDALKDAVASIRSAIPKEVASPLTECVRHLTDLSANQLLEKYRKMVSRVADRLGKTVQLVVVPADLELEPTFFSRFDEALVHVLRNAVDHGIESIETRKASGKPPAGCITVQVERTEKETIVQVSDDGGGIRVEEVVRKAIARDSITEEEADGMTREEKLDLIFGSGISTAGEVSDLSGRGVGMSAVRDCMRDLSGTVTLTSEEGKGTRIELRAPSR